MELCIIYEIVFMKYILHISIYEKIYLFNDTFYIFLYEIIHVCTWEYMELYT